MSNGREYGPAGLVAIGTPQANPTVEAELRILLPPEVAMATARLTSRSDDPRRRLREYLYGLEETLEHFDRLRIDAFGFACTASSYLLGAGEEERLVASAQARFGYPIHTACGAIEWQLRRLGARRLAIASPYPSDMATAAAAFWRQRGFEVAAVERVETGSADTRSIYDLRAEDARQAVERLSGLDVDAVLLSGTGMPTLGLIAGAGDAPRLASTNLCLALRLCEAIGARPPALDEWRPRLELARGRSRGEACP